MGHSQRLAPIFVMLVAFACHNEPAAKDAEISDKAKVCAGAGATLNGTSNECECAAGSKWNGSKCEQEQTATEKPQAPDATSATTALTPKLREVTPATLIPEGKGKDSKKVADKGDKSHKHTAQRNAPRTVSAAVAASQNPKASCEGAGNHGKWDSEKNRCNCPTGRIWLKGQCAQQSRLSSAKICESDFNGGSWDGTRKRCQCQHGQMWLNQSCMDPHALPSRKVCESEWNRGTWNNKRQVCACPRGGAWNSKNLTCSSRAG